MSLHSHTNTQASSQGKVYLVGGGPGEADLLTVKAIDNLSEGKEGSDYNADLKAVGFGNFFSSLLGGLPLISEVVRSTSNINFGGKSKWSNFFHGIFLLRHLAF